MHTLPNIQAVYDHARCLYTKKDVEQALDRMAAAIDSQLAEQNPVILCVMMGGLVLAGNLLPRLNFCLEVDYLHVSRYQHKMQGGQLHWIERPHISLSDRTVLIVDDVLEGGSTLAEIMQECSVLGAKKIYTAVLIDKQNVQRSPGGLAKTDFAALTMANGFIFGYGMDYQGYLRNVPGIYLVDIKHEQI